MGRRVERPQVAITVYHGHPEARGFEKSPVARYCQYNARAEQRLLYHAYRSSIISKGGRLSNWPSPRSSPAEVPLSFGGLSIGDNGNHDTGGSG